MMKFPMVYLIFHIQVIDRDSKIFDFIYSKLHLQFFHVFIERF